MSPPDPTAQPFPEGPAGLDRLARTAAVGVPSDTGVAAGPGSHPDRLGDYRILRRVGEGGMGIVYEAVREALRSHVALKVMHPRYRGDDDYLRRFRTEASSAAGLHHTNIVSVFDYGEHDGVYYYAMQFIIGQGLDRVLEDVRRLRAAGAESGARPGADPGPTPIASTRAQDDSRPARGDASRLAAQGLLSGQYGLTATGIASPTLVANGLSPTLPLDLSASAGSPIGFVLAEPAEEAEASDLSASASVTLPGRAEERYYREVARLGAQVADALDHAHRRGVIHRDIKPSNLLIDALGNAWVTDFGLAKFEVGDDLSHAGTVVGTLRYMAPERFDGQSDRLGDLYGLGATLYEMLALRPAFPARTQLELIEQIRAGRVVPLRGVDPRIPRDLETVVLKAMAFRPADRYATASALADDLRSYLARRPVRARRASPVERFVLWCRRNPGLAASNIAAATLTTALAIGSTAAAWNYRYQRDEVRRGEVAGRERLFEAMSYQARYWRASRRVGQRFEALNSLTHAARIGRELGLPPDRFAPLRDEAIAALALPDLKPARPIVPPRGTDVILREFDPGLTRYAERHRGGAVVVRNVADGCELARFEGRGDAELYIFRFSPDGRYLASTDHAPSFGLSVWDVERATRVIEDRGPVSGAAAQFSPDGRHLLLAHTSGRVLTYDLATGRVVRSWSVPSAPPSLAFDPEGRRVAVVATEPGTGKPACLIVDAANGRVGCTIPLDAPGGSVTWSADGSTVAMAWDGRHVGQWDAATGRLTAPFVGPHGAGGHFSYHPSGALAASNDWSAVLRLWEPASGRVLYELGDMALPRFAADGRLVVEDDTGSRIHEVSAAPEHRTFAHRFDPPAAFREPAVHPGGRLLVVGCDAGLLFWDLTLGVELGSIAGERAVGVRFDAAGRLVTSGTLGVCRRTVAIDEAAGTVRLGAPEPLGYFPSLLHRFAMDAGGRVVALPNGRDVLVHTPAGDRRIGSLNDCRYATVSADGRWVAAGSHLGEGITVWSVAEAREVVRLPGSGSEFSPDGRYLLINGIGASLYETSTWGHVRSIGGFGLAFMPDGRALLVQDPDEAFRLVECPTGRTLARFEAAVPHGATFASFSHDGSRLVITTQDGPAVHVWDLRAIRAALVGMGLDWDAPAFPPEPTTGAPPRALALHAEPIDPRPRTEALAEAESSYRRGHWHRARGLLAPALADFRAAVRRDPESNTYREWLVNTARALGDVDGEIGRLRAMVAEHPRPAAARVALASVLGAVGRHQAAEAEAREALRGEPTYARAEEVLGATLEGQRRWPEAAEAYARAIRLGDDTAPVHRSRAWCLRAAGRDREAEAEARAAIELDPNLGFAYQVLGWSLLSQRRWAEAADAYRQAIRRNADNAGAHAELGDCLLALEDPAAALVEFRRAASLLPQGSDAAKALAGLADRLERLPALERGDDRPRDAEDALNFAELAARRHRDAEAVAHYEAAFTAAPRLADQRGSSWHRYNAACVALRAANATDGRGGPTNPQAQAAHRARAHRWLADELAGLAWEAEATSPAGRPAIAEILRWWHHDPDLAGVRGPDALRTLPAPERAAWDALWRGHDRLLRLVAPPG